MEGCFGCAHAAIVIVGSIPLAIDAIAKWWQRRKSKKHEAEAHP